MIDSKYIKLGITVIIATIIANLLLFIILSWNTPSPEDFQEMQKEYAKNAASMQSQARERIKKQIQLQTHQATNNQSNKAYWHVDQTNYNEIEKQRREDRVRLNRKKSEERALKAQQEQAARRLANERAKTKYESERARLAFVRKTNDETCSYWREQYKNNKSDYNKTYRDSACLRAEND